MAKVSAAGVSSVAKDGSTPLKGDVTLSEGADVTITQVGQDIEIAATGGSGGTVDSVVAGNNIDVDATDPANPIVAVETLTLADISDVTASATEVNYTDGVTSAIQTQLNAKQALDSDLTTIAGLTATTGNIMMSVSSAWASRTPAEVMVILGPVIYPVGMLVELTVATNPATLWGFGTWAYYGEGRVAVAVNSGGGTFGTGGATGGAETHQLTVAELAAHTHIVSQSGSINNSGGSTARTGATGAQASSSTGGDGAHNNLQPYIVVYRWERTA